MFNYWESNAYAENKTPKINPLAETVEKTLMPFEYSCSKVPWKDETGQERTDIFVSAQSDVRREATPEETMAALSRVQEKVWQNLQSLLTHESTMQVSPEITKTGRRNRLEMHYGQIALMDQGIRIIIIPHGDLFLPQIVSSPGSRKYRELARGITSKRLAKTLQRERTH